MINDSLDPLIVKHFDSLFQKVDNTNNTRHVNMSSTFVCLLFLSICNVAKEISRILFL